jgi:hypothetical protein
MFSVVPCKPRLITFKVLIYRRNIALTCGCSRPQKAPLLSSLCFLRRLILDVTATLSRQFHCCSQKEMRYNHGVVSPVPAPGVRHQQRWGAEHSVKRRTASSTPALRWEMMGMDNVSKASSLHIVKGAELELPFGSRAKMARWSGRRVLTADLHTRSTIRYTEAS